jgi:ribosomal protein S18 acetylase RimI-like enzyme
MNVDMSDVLNPMCMLLIAGLSIALQNNLVQYASSQGYTSTTAEIVVKSFIPFLLAMPVAILSRLYMALTVQGYIDTSMKQGVRDLYGHCRGNRRGLTRRCWVVQTEGGAIVGFIVTCAVAAPNNEWLPPHSRINNVSEGENPGQGLAIIEWLVVDKTFRRQGIASTLLLQTETFCQGLDQDAYGHMRLVCSSQQQDAVSFYKRSNYTVEREGSMSMLGEYDLYMWKPL